MAHSVNTVWNYCNATQKYALRGGRKRWLSAPELCGLTAGSSKELVLPAKTIQAVCYQYVQSRVQHKKACLKWRGRKSLGWVPATNQTVNLDKDAIVFARRRYRLWMSRPFPDAKFVSANFCQDAKGRWYVNLVFDVPIERLVSTGRDVGVDLGLKDFATTSDGEKITNPRHFRQEEEKLAKFQRAGKKKQARNLHAKVANRRKDSLHKASLDLVQHYDALYVGDVNAKALMQTKMAKSVGDAGWSTFRRMLSYKAIRHGRTYREVDERFTTQVCSSCSARSGPKGLKDLEIRQWGCSECGAEHNRDVNAAKNIAALGRQSLAEGDCWEQ